MKRMFFVFTILLVTYSLFTQNRLERNLVGEWTFDNPEDLTEASSGNSLELIGSHTAVDGSEAGDGAVNIGVGSYYKCYHDIAANGGGSWVNEYSIVFDFKIPSLGQYYCFFQTNNNNSNDGDVFINPAGNIGISGTGYSNYVVIPNEWYRLVISVDLGNSFEYYLDENLIQNGGVQPIDGRYALYPANGENEILFFADENGEDNPIDISSISIYDTNLDADEIADLGGFGHSTGPPPFASMLPYLQTPTASSIYINWHENNSTESIVDYGTTEDLNQTQSGDYFEFDDGRIWHNVHLTNLTADTKYYYKCVSDTANSEVRSFRTQPNSGIGHVRFAVYGDTRTDFAKHTEVILAIKETVEEVYQEPLEDYLNLILNVGDIVTWGTYLEQYQEEYFLPISEISGNVPFMVSIGNHEVESQYFYDYMKYEDFDGVEGELYYSFEIESILFIALNSNTQGNIQVNWLENELEDAQEDEDISMIFIMLHHPGRSELWPDGNTSWVQEEIIPMLAQFDKAEALFYGHSHNYERGVWDTGNLRLLLAGGGGSSLDRWGMYANQEDYHEIHRAHDYYGYTIFDVNLDNNSYTAESYSLGHSDLPMGNVVFDSFERFGNSDAPETPQTLSPVNVSSNVLVASPFTSEAVILSSQFQLTSIEGDWQNTVLDEIRHWENVYGDSGAPDYIPTDLNAGIDLTRADIDNLQDDNIYWWRVRYRDQNLNWSEWSSTAEFSFGEIESNANFSADITEGNTPLEVRFTDISLGNVTSWIWDFDEDGEPDSYEQDPTFVFSVAGTFSVTLTVTIDGEQYNETKEDYIVVSGTNTENSEIISNFELNNYPNPFNPSTKISFNIPNKYIDQSQNAEIVIYNLKGQTVKSFTIPSLLRSENSITWYGNDQNNDQVGSGIFFYKLVVDGEVKITKKCLLLK